MPDLTDRIASVTGGMRTAVVHSAERSARATMVRFSSGTDAGAAERTVDAAERSVGAR
jgi:hypothetical protein